MPWTVFAVKSTFILANSCRKNYSFEIVLEMCWKMHLIQILEICWWHQGFWKFQNCNFSDIDVDVSFQMIFQLWIDRFSIIDNRTHSDINTMWYVDRSSCSRGCCCGRCGWCCQGCVVIHVCDFDWVKINNSCLKWCWHKFWKLCTIWSSGTGVQDIAIWYFWNMRICTFLCNFSDIDLNIFYLLCCSSYHSHCNFHSRRRNHCSESDSHLDFDLCQHWVTIICCLGHWCCSVSESRRCCRYWSWRRCRRRRFDWWLGRSWIRCWNGRLWKYFDISEIDKHRVKWLQKHVAHIIKWGNLIWRVWCVGHNEHVGDEDIMSSKNGPFTSNRRTLLDLNINREDFESTLI